MRHRPWCLVHRTEEFKYSIIQAEKKFLFLGGGVSGFTNVPLTAYIVIERRRLGPNHLNCLTVSEEKIKAMTESQFLKRFVRPFEDVVPNLHDIYVNNIGSSIQWQNRRGKNTGGSVQGESCLAASEGELNSILAKRVLPGHLVLELLKEKGLIGRSLVLCTSLTFSEGKFLRKFLLPFQDVVPNLHEAYLNSKGS
ncbi:LOW QUALITY PROTEIN: hypothetical protein Cgig2_022064 [Carnegiea gigantea]|uniref:Uncharacterized protein n=1 Tax=Carnegiea gigantea TaxID=171969 RepID=A0A9Q1KPK8_9CARY|nr:LOW QUALITY PROTEIN: hypothetical protein Cgig2_022064 [Carnegiea gigantea]